MQLIGLAFRIASLKNKKAKAWVDGRKGLLSKIKTEVNCNNIVWVHCASLGEFEQGRPLIDEIKLKYPQKKILLTFFSPSGYEIQKEYKNADYVYYLPLDSYTNARRFVKYVNPDIVFFIKYEYWYNYLFILNKKKIPVYFVSSIFRKNQIFFKKYGFWFRKQLKTITHFFVQSEESVELLTSINILNCSVTGDTRFDRVAHIMETVKPLTVVEHFINGDNVIVVGSSWKAENALLQQYLRKNTTVKVIFAPHVVTDENIQQIMHLFGDKAILYSQAVNENVDGKQVLVIDCYGLLTSLYQYGTIAIIGGGFGVGIHNVLEAATFGMPVIFGPNYTRFKEAVELVDKKCAFVVNNIEEFNAIVMHLLRDEVLTEDISKNAALYVQGNVGATQKILQQVFSNSSVLD